MDFDRSRPLYRLFMMDDGSRAWHSVEADNTPGRAVMGWEAEVVESLVDKAPWKDAFYAALENNRKATVYAQTIPPYEVPEGCTAILRNASIIAYQGRPLAFGAVYGDRTHRFRDGHSIHTSKIVSGPDENHIITTQNSRYKLEGEYADHR